ncbi:hypothetical protein B738_27327 [Photorhabdus temperata subsp. temperata M1021]|nr:hypothetical protein B738_27327 [Photorhabdus temperata subsp. temperata M1021]
MEIFMTKEPTDESHDMQIFLLNDGKSEFGNVGSAHLKDRSMSPTNPEGELNNVVVQPNGSPWIGTLDKKNQNKSIILVGSWDKFTNSRFFFTQPIMKLYTVNLGTSL